MGQKITNWFQHPTDPSNTLFSPPFLFFFVPFHIYTTQTAWQTRFFSYATWFYCFFLRCTTKAAGVCEEKQNFPITKTKILSWGFQHLLYANLVFKICYDDNLRANTSILTKLSNLSFDLEIGYVRVSRRPEHKYRIKKFLSYTVKGLRIYI